MLGKKIGHKPTSQSVCGAEPTNAAQPEFAKSNELRPICQEKRMKVENNRLAEEPKLSPLTKIPKK